MGKWPLALVGGGCALVALVALWQREALVEMASRAAFRPPPISPEEQSALSALGATLGRNALPAEPATPSVALPEPHAVATNAQELAEYVAWMRSLGHDELLRLSNAEFDFEKSELVRLLQELRGPWVLPALGELALLETDPLLQAILVVGLAGSAVSERLQDERLLPILDGLMTRMGIAAEDPYRVARNLADEASMACMSGNGDYVALMRGHLATSDNGSFLIHGYLFMGRAEGGAPILEEMLTGHPSAEGRMGALEGLRHGDGAVAPGELTTLGLAALEGETNSRNRLLLYEMLVASGGEDGVGAVEEIARSGQVSEIPETVGFLAQKMEPARALALLEDVLARPDLDAAARQALYNALGVLPGEEGADRLLALAGSDELAPEERLAGLRGLWNRPIDERLADELRGLLEGHADPALRVEALRMLANGESDAAGLDLRSLAALDDDPSVRSEAVQLAAMRPGEDTRAWLEQRLMQDDSLDVKAAALGALVYQAHYGGGGEAVLGYLAQARRYTDDEDALAMIAEGERMVKSYDPRRVDLELAEDAKLYETLARYSDGPAQRSFQRQARLLASMVSAVRNARR